MVIVATLLDIQFTEIGPIRYASVKFARNVTEEVHIWHNDCT